MIMGKMGEYERQRCERGEGVGAVGGGGGGYVCVWVFASEGTKPRLAR